MEGADLGDIDAALEASDNVVFRVARVRRTMLAFSQGRNATAIGGAGRGGSHDAG
jgi:hypothetical protein